jgi:GNAT superfamily N-acetyltransferase
VSTPDSYAWGVDHPVPSERTRRWVATHEGRVVGFAVAARAAWTTGRVAVMYFGVEPAMRDRGIGRRLYDAAQAHVARLTPTRTMSATERGDEASIRFLAARGFHHTRDDQAWSVDPRAVPVAELAARRATAEAAGFRLVTARSLLDRPEALYRLNLALEHDLPSDVPIAEAYEPWRTQELESPLFSPDASFCVMAGDVPVAMTWIRLDHAGRRAAHGMTGTLPEYRHRGLAHLVKLASIAWLADHGVTALFADNDTQNRDMLLLNEHLGFRPLTVFELWARND